MSFQTLRFLGAEAEAENVSAIIVGLPWDRTASYRPGSRFGPNAIRVASDSIETYDPSLDMDLAEMDRYADLGDLVIESSVPDEAIEEIRSALSSLPAGLPTIGLGGEHTVTRPLFERLHAAHPDLVHIVLDAHADLRESYEGTIWSHACATSRVMELVGPERIGLFGIRSGTKEEFALMREHGMLHDATEAGITACLEQWDDRPVYVSIDLDGFDPSLVPGTGTVEAGGLSWQQFELLTRLLRSHNVVGADVVELAPDLDPSGRSSVLAARVVRSLLALILK